MPDALTPAERAAIERYTGPIRVIPRGVSGLTEYGAAPTWAEQIKTGFDLGKKIRAGMARAKAEREAAKARMEILPGETRKETIARLQCQGRTHREIGDFLGVSHVTVWKISRGKLE
jgi:DNA-binding NarL/FixJ family response regulator